MPVLGALSARLGDGALAGRKLAVVVHLDSLLGERSADGVLRREPVRPGSDHVRAGLAQREHEARSLRLQMHDDGDAPARERAVPKALVEQPVEDRHVLPRPVDAPPPFRGERGIGDARHP